MKTSTQLIVLSTTRTGESSVVLHTLSRDYGRRSFVVSVSRKNKVSSLLMPMNVLDAEIVENPKSSLWRAVSLSACHPLVSLRSDIFKNAMTMFMSEVLYRAVREESYEEGLFEWCEKSILTLDAMDSDYANYHLWFLLELCLALGFRPSSEDMAPFAGGLYGELSAFMKSSFAEAMLIPLSGRQRTELAGIILEYLSHHLEVGINIKSLDVLHQLFRS